MKLFKKLIAAALVGAMALTMLVGCASSVNKKEMLAILNDMSGQRVTLKDAGTKQADAVIALAQKAYDETAEDKKKDFDPTIALFGEDFHNDKAEATKAGVKKVKEAIGINESNNGYMVGFGEVKSYENQYNQVHATQAALNSAWNNMVTLTKARNAGNKGTASIDTVKLGEKEYVVIVIMVVG